MRELLLLVDEPDTPASEVRLRLLAARQSGRPFPRAWSSALRTATKGMDQEERTEWLAAFKSTRGHWEAAYGSAAVEPDLLAA